MEKMSIADRQKLMESAHGDERVDVHFLVGGTRTNVAVISATSSSYQGVITPPGAANIHETERFGGMRHKCLCIETPDEHGVGGSQLHRCTFADESFEHMVQPKMSVHSNPTEIGTIYKKAELEAIYQVCKSVALLFSWMRRPETGYGLMCKKMI